MYFRGTLFVAPTGGADYSSHTTAVKNKNLLEIPAAGFRSGMYWLSIYDAQRKLIGTEKIMKY